MSTVLVDSSKGSSVKIDVTRDYNCKFGSEDGSSKVTGVQV